MKGFATAAIFLVACAAEAQSLPDIRPGQTCEKLRATYGNELSVEGPAHNWKQAAIEIKVLVKPGGPCVVGAVQYSIEPRHAIATRDGIFLGSDTTTSASTKLKGRINSTSFYFIRGEGKAYAMLEVQPSAAFPFKETYGWVLDSVRESKLTGPPQLSDFSTEPVTFYALDPPDPQGAAR